MEIKILFEDENFLVIDKPAGILVHPKNTKDKSYTIVSWLKERYPNLKKLDWLDTSRIGIVHRLDQDTSGLLILAKNPQILQKLQDQFRKRTIKKTYFALVFGNVKSGPARHASQGDAGGGEIESYIGQGKDSQISRFLNLTGKMKPSKLVYNIVRHYKFDENCLTLLEIKPETGRTHQIRVQLNHIGFPIIGDPIYNTKISKRISKQLGLERQFLHAQHLDFTHPISGRKMNFESILPEELEKILLKNIEH